MKPGIRLTASLLIASLALPVRPAGAELLDTDAALGGERERIAAVFEREEVRVQLEARGVDPAHAKARIAALTDEEAARIAAQLETLPAGGRLDAFTFAVLIVLFLPVALVVGAVALVAAAVKNSTASTTHQTGDQL